MLQNLIEGSIRYRWMVLMAAIAVAIAGVYSALQLPLDAIPDLTNVQVQVVTSAGSMSPIDVERYVTYPLEKELNGLPKMEELRSISRLGISLITVVFEEGTDLYWARQIVDQRLRGIAPMPNGIGQPQLGPLTTALGEVLQFEVRGDPIRYSPTQLRSVLEWQIAPNLKSVPGVVEVNAHGGNYLAFEIQPDPEKLRATHLSLDDLVMALERNNVSTGGGYMIAGSQQRFIQGEALLQSLEDVRRISLRAADEGAPIFLRDVAEVTEGSLLRQGLSTRDGRGEIVIGMAMMLTGQNSRLVVQRVKERLDEIAESLPEGVTTEVIYDREGLIHRAISTVGRNLLEGGVLVVIVLLVFLGSVRAGLITAIAIPLSMMFAVNMMNAWGIAASLMSLGAIDFGIIVDSSVIMIENCTHRLGLATPGMAKGDVIRDASIEVRRPTLFGELIIASVYIPVLLLEGSAGKLFRPMALTVLLALFGSLVVSMTVMPALATLFLKAPKLEHGHEKPSWIMRMSTALYRPMLQQILKYPVGCVLIALATVAVSLPLAWNLGAEFMPRLEEGDMLIEAVRLPSATLEDAVPMSTAIEDIVRRNPEVRTVFCKTGRPEIANDIMGVHQTDVWVMLTPKETWSSGVTRESLIERFSEQLQNAIPGVRFGFTQPIEMRVDELVAGVKADIAVLIYGDDLKQLAKLGRDIERILNQITGSADVKSEYQANLSTLKIELDREAVGRYGVDTQTVIQSVAALGQLQVGTAYVGRTRIPIMVKLPEHYRSNIDQIRMLPLETRQGTTIPLKDIASIEFKETPPAIEHEWNRRRTYVSANVRGRDVASFVAEAQRRVDEEIPLPQGYEIRWGGDFESLQSASLRLSIITPIVLVMIGVLLFLTFHSLRLTTLIFCVVPVAASGGVFALALRGLPFSISAGVGFIALFGIAVLNSLVWVSAAENFRASGLSLNDVVRETALARLRPILMTASVAALGFVPMALSHGDGAEIQRPLATVVIGGIITSTMLTTMVLPAVYPWFVARIGALRPRPQSSGITEAGSFEQAQ